MPRSAAFRYAHRRRRLTGRDPNEDHRSATPLELLYDLTFVVAFGIAADEFAHYVADDHIATGVIGFCFAVFAVTWCWVNYSWFASAYDTDDWVCRLAVMVQMVGVIVIALGLQPMFESIEAGDTLHIDVIVAGYVVIRAAMLFLWVRAMRHDPDRAPSAQAYIATIAIAEVLYIPIALANLSVPATFALLALPLALEFAGPVIAERRQGTPWHAHHIAERYGLLVIITLGEGIIGTVASVDALVHGLEGWSVETALYALAGIALTFGAWWMYFCLPWADLIELRRDRAFRWGYLHFPIFGSIAAIGGGLHVAAYYLEGEAHIDLAATVWSVVIPFAAFTAVLYGLYAVVIGEFDRFHILLVVATAGILAATAALAAAGASLVVCLLVLALAPVVTVIGFETIGHRHVADVLERMGPVEPG